MIQKTNKDLSLFWVRNCKKMDAVFFFHQGDADVQIIKKTWKMAEEVDTVFIGDDTDLLVLLLYHDEPRKNMFFEPEPKKNAMGRVWISSK